jgi:hypothetical protein
MEASTGGGTLLNERGAQVAGCSRRLSEARLGLLHSDGYNSVILFQYFLANIAVTGRVDPDRSSGQVTVPHAHDCQISTYSQS